MTLAQWKEIVTDAAPALAGAGGIGAAVAAWWGKVQEGHKQSRADLQADYDRSQAECARLRTELDSLEKENRTLQNDNLRLADAEQKLAVYAERDKRLGAMGMSAFPIIARLEQDPKLQALFK